MIIGGKSGGKSEDNRRIIRVYVIGVISEDNLEENGELSMNRGVMCFLLGKIQRVTSLKEYM